MAAFFGIFAIATIRGEGLVLYRELRPLQNLDDSPPMLFLPGLQANCLESNPPLRFLHTPCFDIPSVYWVYVFSLIEQLLFPGHCKKSSMLKKCRARFKSDERQD